MDEGRQPLSRKFPIPASKINPYRMIILLRIVITGLFFHYRILHPVNHAYGLWLTSVICEIWFTLAWILDQLPKWSPVERETYLDRLSFRWISLSPSSTTQTLLLCHFLKKIKCESLLVYVLKVCAKPKLELWIELKIVNMFLKSVT